MSQRGIRSFALGAAFAALTASCGIFDPDGRDDVRDDLAAAKELWRSQGFDSYEFVLRRLCFCGGGTEPAAVVVRNGARVSVTVVETGQPMPANFAQYYLTVPELFTFIEDAIARDADSIVVSYDRQYGFPTSIRIDYARNTADEEMAYEASALRPLR
jgi:hypothetical protein